MTSIPTRAEERQKIYTPAGTRLLIRQGEEVEELLVGDVNESGGVCDCCPLAAEQIFGYRLPTSAKGGRATGTPSEGPA